MREWVSSNKRISNKTNDDEDGYLGDPCSSASVGIALHLVQSCYRTHSHLCTDRHMTEREGERKGDERICWLSDLFTLILLSTGRQTTCPSINLVYLPTRWKNCHPWSLHIMPESFPYSRWPTRGLHPVGVMRAKGDLGPSPVLTWERNDVRRRKECNRSGQSTTS